MTWLNVRIHHVGTNFSKVQSSMGDTQGENILNRTKQGVAFKFQAFHSNSPPVLLPRQIPPRCRSLPQLPWATWWKAPLCCGFLGTSPLRDAYGCSVEWSRVLDFSYRAEFYGEKKKWEEFIREQKTWHKIEKIASCRYWEGRTIATLNLEMWMRLYVSCNTIITNLPFLLSHATQWEQPPLRCQGRTVPSRCVRFWGGGNQRTAYRSASPGIVGVSSGISGSCGRTGDTELERRSQILTLRFRIFTL